MRFLIVVALLVAGAVIAALGTADQHVNLSSMMSLWSDTLRDTDQIGLRLTRIGDTEEMSVGADLAKSILAYRTEDATASAYVTDVAKGLLPLVRRKGVKYHFYVLKSTDVNAFSVPGGHVFATSGLLNFLESEAELAAVLGHEISHVDLRHCVERYQYRLALKKAGVPDGLGWLAETAYYLAVIGYSRDQERDADSQGERLTIEARYDPKAAAALFVRMGARFGEFSHPRAATPAGEMGQAVGEALGSYFQTHPLSEERAARMREMGARYRGRFYVGKENLRRRIARSRLEIAGEFLAF